MNQDPPTGKINQDSAPNTDKLAAAIDRRIEELKNQGKDQKSTGHSAETLLNNFNAEWERVANEQTRLRRIPTWILVFLGIGFAICVLMVLIAIVAIVWSANNGGGWAG